jgi:MoxR-like ATPase
MATVPTAAFASQTTESRGRPDLHTSLGQAVQRVNSVYLGKPEIVRLAFVCLLAEGHLLLEDVPGTGKTLLAQALAKVVGGTFHRIQFTPDLLPSDLLGTSVLVEGTSEFIFKPGPIFAQFILADEINRASPRTQSSLLEAMADRQVSVDGKTHPLGQTFCVLATQNPTEFEGTYPLPESQLDRFLVRLHMGYPDRDAERAILEGHRTGEPVEGLEPVLSTEILARLQAETRAVRFDKALVDYLLDVVEATRRHPEVRVGASTRAALALYRAAQASALLENRKFVIPDDVKRLAGPVLSHRLLLRNSHGPEHGMLAEALLARMMEKLPVPG